MGSFIDRRGRRYGRLTVLERDANRGQNTVWKCQCDCGERLSVLSLSLTSGNTQSCGCLQRERTIKHGNWDHELYKVWNAMVQRCTKPNSDGYKDYGARGITVCDEWMNDLNQFLADMGPRPSPEHEIDRIDNDGPYCKANCQWSTRQENMRHTRATHFIEYQERRMAMVAWAEELGIPYKTLHQRIKGRKWPVERAFTTPVTRRA